MTYTLSQSYGKRPLTSTVVCWLCQHMLTTVCMVLPSWTDC